MAFRTGLRVVLVAVVAAVATTACGGGTSSSGDGPTTAASDPAPAGQTGTVAGTTGAPAPPTTASGLGHDPLCADYHAADAASQRAFAEVRSAATELTTAETLAGIASACTDARGPLTVSEALEASAQETLDELRAATVDEYAETRIGGKVQREIRRSIRRSWNVCGDGDVCIPGTVALAVQCRQQDLQVMRLACFVTTERGEGEGSNDYGYTVAVDVGRDGTYSWRLER